MITPKLPFGNVAPFDDQHLVGRGTGEVLGGPSWKNLGLTQTLSCRFFCFPLCSVVPFLFFFVGVQWNDTLYSSCWFALAIGGGHQIKMINVSFLKL